MKWEPITLSIEKHPISISRQIVFNTTITTPLTRIRDFDLESTEWTFYKVADTWYALFHQLSVPLSPFSLSRAVPFGPVQPIERR